MGFVGYLDFGRDIFGKQSFFEGFQKASTSPGILRGGVRATPRFPSSALLPFLVWGPTIGYESNFHPSCHVALCVGMARLEPPADLC